MTRTELILHVLHQARDSGFEFRKWLRTEAARTWTTPEDAVQWLSQGSRIHMLLFSHTFARAFFRSGNKVRYILPAATFQRTLPNGKIKQISRRAYTRESNHQDVWQWHLCKMAAEPEPLRYARRFLILEEVMHAANKPETAQCAAPDPEEPNYDEELLVRE